MTKKGYIALGIFIVIIALFGVLFGAVFCLRTQNVTFLDGEMLSVNKKEIVSIANFKNGESIFLLDKEAAINKIEKKYPEIKVVHIKTTGVTSINIMLRRREKMFYTEYLDNYYIVDEDLKVLEILEKVEEPMNKPTDLIFINSENLEIDENTKLATFVGSSKQQNIISNLYKSMLTVVVNEEGFYLEREDVKDMIKSVHFEEFKTFDKIIIETKYGVKLDIENPSKNLQNKINTCFSTIKTFILEANNKEKQGTIKIYYDIDNNQKCVYINE